jgi:hypothetical protein
MDKDRQQAENARQRFEAREERLASLKKQRKQRIEDKKHALDHDGNKQKEIADAIERVRSRQGKEP